MSIRQWALENSQKGKEEHRQASIFMLGIFQAKVSAAPACNFLQGCPETLGKVRECLLGKKGQTEHGL